MTLSDYECVAHMSEPRKTLLRRYSAATQRALARADFLKTTDPVTVQALTLFLVSPGYVTIPLFVFRCQGYH